MPGDIPLGKSPSGSHPPWLTLLPQQFPVPSATQNPPTHLLHALNGILAFLLQTPSLPQDSVSFTEWEEGSMPQDGPCRQRESEEDAFLLPKLPDTTSARKIPGTNTELPASTSARAQPYFIFINMLW